MTATDPIAFSPGGEHLAQSTADGRIKIWETATGTLKQEYTPSSHLAATCTCISWCPVRHKNVSTKKKKKRRSEDVHSAVGDLDLIALGTLSGNILLFSVVKGELQSQLSNGHSEKVNGVCWNREASYIYSGSDDHQLVEWDVVNGSVRRKWSAGKDSVHSLCISYDGTALFTGCRNILWWDVKTCKVVKKFTGHATEICQLLFVSYPDSSTDDGYLISFADGDRYINAWYLNRKSDDHNALATFSLKEEVVYMEVTKPTSRDQTLLLSAITKVGELKVFEHHLNGRCVKPLQPTLSVTITTDHKTTKPLPIQCVHICDDINRNICLAYGNSMKLAFDRLKYSSGEKEICLKRNDPNKLRVTLETTVTKIKQPQSSGANVLVPGHMMPTAPTSADQSKKRKREIVSSNQLPMEERLNVLTLDQEAPSGSSVPRVQNMANLLVQGLQSEDSKLLTNVLTLSNDEVIESTVSSLQIPAIIPLLKELQKRVHNHRSFNSAYLKWIRRILSTHTTYLLACPDLERLLGSLYQLLDARTQMFEKISKLKGRMEVILTQLTSKPNTELFHVQSNPILTYEDDSSEGEATGIDYGASDDEVNWENISDEEEDRMEVGSEAEEQENNLSENELSEDSDNRDNEGGSDDNFEDD